MSRTFFVLMVFLLAGLRIEANGQVLPFQFDSLTSADAGRAVKVALDGVLAAVIEPGISRFFGGTTNNVRTYCRTPATTTWTEIDLASDLAVCIDVGASRLAAGFQGRVDVWDFSFNAIKPSSSFWTRQGTITFTNVNEVALGLQVQGDRLAVLVRRVNSFVFGDFDRFARIYERSGTNWNAIAECGINASSDLFADDMSLDGDRLAICSYENKTIQLHDRNSGGANNWGVSGIIWNNPTGFEYPFFSVALAGSRLAASALDPVSGQQVVLAYTNQAGAWLYAGPLLTNISSSRMVLLDSDGSRLAAHSIPDSESLSTTPFWVFSPGNGTAGWVLERAGRTGPFGFSEFDYLFSATRGVIKPSISSNSAFFGMGDTNTLGDISGWAATVYTRSSGGLTNWGIEKIFQAEGTPGEFGAALAMSEKFMVSGMPGESGNQGAAYVWYLSDQGGGKAWLPAARLAKENPQAGDRFGASVAIYSEPDSYSAMVAVGAPGEFTDKGAVYLYGIYYGVGQVSLPKEKFLMPPFDTNALFGASVALNDKFLVVGAPLSDISGANQGATYIYGIDTGGTNNWGLLKTNAAPSAGYGFGSKVSINQGLLCVTRPYTNGTGPAVFVYARNAGGTDNWGYFTNIPPPAGSPTGFAASVDSLSTFVFIGATGSPVGKAYALMPDTAGVFRVVAEMAGTTNEGPSFGSSIDFRDGAIAVGAPLAAGGGTARGRVRLYQFNITNATDWTAVNGTADGEQLGAAVAGDLFYTVAGAPFSNTNGPQSGRVRTIRAGSYEMWAASQPAAFTNQWWPEQDWDGDRSANLMEFAMGSDPMNPASASNLAMQVVTEGSTRYFGWLMPSNVYYTDGLEYRMEDSVDMKTWARENSLTSTNSLMRLFLINTTNRNFRLAPVYPVFNSGSATPVLL